MADDYYNGGRYRDRSRSLSRSPRGRSRSRSLDKRRSYSRSPRRSYSRSYSRSPSRSPRRSRRYQSRSRSRSPKYRRSYSRSRSRSPYRRRRRSYSRSPSRSPRRSYGRRYRSRSPRGGGRGTRWNPEPSRVLGVFGLSLYTTERELRDLFSKYGDIEKVQVIHDHITGRSRGFSFVYFRDHEDAQDAKAETNGIEVDGRRIRVDFSITSRAHSPTPGKYMGRPTRVRRYSRSRSRSR